MGVMPAGSGIASFGMREWNDGYALSDRVRTRGVRGLQRLRRRLTGLRAGIDTRQSCERDRADVERVSRGPSAGAAEGRGASGQGVDPDWRPRPFEGESRHGCGARWKPHESAQGGEFAYEWSLGREAAEGARRVARNIDRTPESVRARHAAKVGL